MFKFLFVVFLIKLIYSIGPEFFIPNEGPSFKVNLEEFCPCDKTAEVCDLKCCCDEYCLNYMFDNEYFEKYGECDPLSYVNNRIDSRLDYCEGHKKSIDDLYNPLVFAFKILKKGFCLAKKNPKKQNNDKNEIYKGLKEEIENKEKSMSSVQENDFDEVIPHRFEISFEVNSIGYFAKMNLNAPISLPNGLCLFNSYPIKRLVDYEVECSYHRELNEQIKGLFPNPNKMFLINNNFFTEVNNTLHYIKKVEITYKNDGSYTIHHYYEEIGSDYIDFIFIVKFLKDDNDYKRSGNPGYIKGKPILIGIKNNNNDKIIDKYKDDFVFPIEGNTIPEYPKDEYFFFFNNYFDNKITFEDIIIYGYKKSDFAKRYIYEFLNDINIYYGKYGNAQRNYQDWETVGNNIDIQKIGNAYLIIGLYKDVGAVNNTQYQIVEFKKNGNEPSPNDKIYYFITKFLKLKTKTDWWYAKGPGFIKLPKNIMYPFRIGTTDYESKKR